MFLFVFVLFVCLLVFDPGRRESWQRDLALGSQVQLRHLVAGTEPQVLCTSPIPARELSEGKLRFRDTW